MKNNSWVLEIDRLSEELEKASYFLIELQGIQISPETAKKYRYFVNIEVLLRAIATCEIDAMYSHAPRSVFDEELYRKVLSGRTVGEYLTFYWLWQILTELAGDRRIAEEYKGLVLHFVWTHIGPLLRSLDLFEVFRLIAQKRTHRDTKVVMQPLIQAILLSLELAIEFRWSRKKKKDSSGSTRNHVEIDFLTYVLQQPERLAGIRTCFDKFVKTVSLNRRKQLDMANMKIPARAKIRLPSA